MLWASWNCRAAQVTRVERVKSFQVPEDGAGFIAYLLEAQTRVKPSRQQRNADTKREVKPCDECTGDHRRAYSGAGGKEAATGRKRNTAPISLSAKHRDRSERTFPDVLDYTLSKDAKTLVYTVSSKNEETNGVYLRDAADRHGSG